MSYLIAAFSKLCKSNVTSLKKLCQSNKICVRATRLQRVKYLCNTQKWQSTGDFFVKSSRMLFFDVYNDDLTMITHDNSHVTFILCITVKSLSRIVISHQVTSLWIHMEYLSWPTFSNSFVKLYVNFPQNNGHSIVIHIGIRHKAIIMITFKWNLQMTGIQKSRVNSYFTRVSHANQLVMP